MQTAVSHVAERCNKLQQVASGEEPGSITSTRDQHDAAKLAVLEAFIWGLERERYLFPPPPCVMQ